ncbi:MAG: ORF6N domain-containing protein [Prevotellaceae bacterium]|jgi:hypothetical protein|nr:ORF6N domain-containing protein [Prevotellaceae bacterium]
MEITVIQNKIQQIRGQKVLLDRDLAEIYGVETKVLNQAVKRNIERFEGEDFMFQLTNKEIVALSRSQIATLNDAEILRSQIATSSESKILRSQIVTSSWGGSRYKPYAFTQLGVAMLSSVLNSKIAIETNRNIMRAFVMLQQFALNYKELADKLREMETQYDRQFTNIMEAINYLLQKDKIEVEQKQRKRIGFNAENE